MNQLIPNGKDSLTKSGERLNNNYGISAERPDDDCMHLDEETSLTPKRNLESHPAKKENSFLIRSHQSAKNIIVRSYVESPVKNEQAKEQRAKNFNDLKNFHQNFNNAHFNKPQDVKFFTSNDFYQRKIDGYDQINADMILNKQQTEQLNLLKKTQMEKLKQVLSHDIKNDPKIQFDKGSFRPSGKIIRGMTGNGGSDQKRVNKSFERIPPLGNDIQVNSLGMQGFKGITTDTSMPGIPRNDQQIIKGDRSVGLKHPNRNSVRTKAVTVNEFQSGQRMADGTEVGWYTGDKRGPVRKGTFS